VHYVVQRYFGLLKNEINNIAKILSCYIDMQGTTVACMVPHNYVPPIEVVIIITIFHQGIKSTQILKQY
jgi:hypothetical protein